MKHPRQAHQSMLTEFTVLVGKAGIRQDAWPRPQGPDMVGLEDGMLWAFKVENPQHEHNGRGATDEKREVDIHAIVMA